MSRREVAYRYISNITLRVELTRKGVRGNTMQTRAGFVVS